MSNTLKRLERILGRRLLQVEAMSAVKNNNEAEKEKKKDNMEKMEKALR